MADSQVSEVSKESKKGKKRFGCPLCGVSCSTRYGFEEHSRKHTGDRPFSCSKCRLSFKRMTGLRKHLQFIHGDSDSIQFNCPECTVKSPVLGNIIRHVLVVHRALKRFICSVCGTKCTQNRDLKVHLSDKHNIKIDNINSQEKKSIHEIHVLPPFKSGDRTPELVDELKKQVDEERKKLEGIEKLIASLKKRKLDMHDDVEDLNLEETSITVPPVYCEKRNISDQTPIETDKSPESAISFVLEKMDDLSCNIIIINDDVNLEQYKVEWIGNSERVELIENKRTVVGNNDQKEKENGEMDFLSNDSTVNIEVISLPEGLEKTLSLPCNICNKTFTDEKKLLRHVKIHADVKPHKCDKCDKSFVEHHNLVVHYRKHTGERPFVCPICSKELRYHKDFVDHCVSHSGLKRFICKQCNKGYRRKRDHDRHLLSHSSEHRFSCEICGKGFTRNYLKEQHVLRHSMVQPTQSENSFNKKVYECDVCRKTYKTNQGFLQHKAKHTGLIDHQCPICSKSFPVANKLQAHLRNHIPRVKYVSCSKCQRMFSSSDTLKIHMDRYHKTETEDAVAAIEETVIYNYEMSDLPQDVSDNISQSLTV